ncbi:EF-P beta-lysylation protein EpmB [Aestuariirhabdus sp. Z084]|uniref:EF-P beta-lysylation protein EpmB n=1 Tax=Aestuariirhabdus haliotis TaxID=2918751 RepID=UPI00201B371B|nr:EF-P beta-lysylation protein EpmB [Aestuariirhabdus haliotis]MCL6415621.1 EF-P beta-lysylation protein EpmB [Aestuariirhabdus haliotis]MCL6419616.1 EF-P beta-lysylation protein EpmB [Aestuariirhabdus haliotis]
MIARTIPSVQTSSWQQLLGDAIRDPNQLLQALDLEAEASSLLEQAHQQFSVVVPEPYLARIKRGDPKDPLLLQVLPSAQELHQTPGFNSDPLGEAASNPLPGLIHKYHNRVLLTLAGHCAINCRYCFRRHFPYQDNTPDRAHWLKVLDYIHQRPEIDEVIFSGGEPLAVNDQRLAWLCAELDKIPHLKRLRIHTRMPVVIPQRIDDRLLHWMGEGRLHKIMVIHSNHPNEIDEAVALAMHKLSRHGVRLLNQSVLLHGINDNEATLEALSNRLFDAGVQPYYLHLLDRVEGAAHFEVAEKRAQQIIANLRGRCSGYLVPSLVRESAGKNAKTIMG